jgi:hypothetical protein
MHVKAGLDGQPVRKGANSTGAPATDRCELGACLRDLRQRCVRDRRELADPVVKGFGEVLVFWACRRVLHASNCTKHLFGFNLIYMVFQSTATTIHR